MRASRWANAVLGCVAAFGAAASGCGAPAGDPDAGFGADAFVEPFDGGADGGGGLPEQFPVPIDLTCAVSLGPSQGVTAMVIDDAGAIYVLGSLYGDVDLDPGPGVEPYVAPMLGASPSYVARFEPDCTYAWTRVFDALSTLRGIGVDDAGTIVVAGAVEMDPIGDRVSVDFDPGAGNDRRSVKNIVFVTRLAPDGSYVSTSTRAWCSPELELLGAECDTRPGGPYDVAIARDGTAYLAMRSEVVRASPEGTFGWPSIPPDGGVPTTGDLTVAPDGALYVTRVLEGDLDWTSGVDAPTRNCPPGGALCQERIVLLRIEPDGSYGRALAQPPNSTCLVHGTAIDSAGDVHIVGTYESGTSGSLSPDFDYSAGVDRWSGSGIYATAMAPQDGALRWSNVYGVGGTTTATAGPLYATGIAVDRDAGIVYRIGQFTASVGTRTGVFFTDDNYYDAVLVAETVDGRPLWSVGLGAPARPPGPNLLIAAGARGRFAIALRAPDIDITPAGVHAPTGEGLSIAVYDPEPCTDGDTRPTACFSGSSILTCAGGRWGPSECAPSTRLSEPRVCERSCEEQSANGVACGTHDDGCGGSVACGACVGAMVCGGSERTCRAPTGTAPIASGLNHPDYRIALDATHVYFVVQGDYPPIGMAPGDATIMRVPRDGSAPASVIATGNRYLEFSVGGDYLYIVDPEAGTLVRRLKDGSGAVETIATDLAGASRPVIDGDFVYYTAARASSPIHIFELRQWVPFAGGDTQIVTFGDERMTAFMMDDTHVYARATPGVGVTAIHRWPRGTFPSPELVMTFEMSMVAIDTAAGMVYGTRPFDQSLYRQPFGSFGPGHILVRHYDRPVEIPAPGHFDGTAVWWAEEGEQAQHTWTGRVRYAVLATGDSTIAHSGLNHAASIVGDADGLFVATRGDLTAHGTTGEIVRVW